MVWIEWNRLVLKVVKHEMIATALLMTDDEILICDLSETIDSISETFVEHRQSGKLEYALVDQYSEMIFADIAYKMGDFVQQTWGALSLWRQVVLFIPFKAAERRIQKLVVLARMAVLTY